MEIFHNFHVNDGIQKRQSVMRLSHKDVSCVIEKR